MALKRITVGVLINQLDGGYQRLLWPGMIEAARKLDVNLVLFAGRIPQLDWESSFQHEAAYHLFDHRRIDGLIVLSGALSMGNPEHFPAFIDQFKSFPIVTISQRVGSYHMVGLDNQSGVITAVEYLIQVQKRKRIAFVKGPKGFVDSEERYEAYLTALSRNRLAFDPELVVYGDFSQLSGERAVDELLKRSRNLDAIYCANDEMAMGVLRRLQSLKIKVPGEIALIGFDNIVECQLISPPIATVAQPTFISGEKSVEDLVTIINGQEPETSRKIPTEFLPRQSCGSLPRAAENIFEKYNVSGAEKPDEDLLDNSDFSKESINEFKDIYQKIVIDPLNSNYYLDFSSVLERELNFLNITIRDIETLNIILTDLRNEVEDKYQPSVEDTKTIERNFNALRTLIGDSSTIKQNIETFEYARTIYHLRAAMSELSNAKDLESFTEILTRHMDNLLLEECWICTYNKPFSHRIGETWDVPKRSELIYAYSNDARLNLTNKDTYFDTSLLLPEWIYPGSKEGCFSTVVMPLFFTELHFGYVIFTLKRGSDSKYESVRELISGVLWRVKLNMDLERSREQLQDSNTRLNMLAVTDELTGLKNRRGFMTFADLHYTYCSRMGGGFAIAYADLDGLKKINDTHGHDSGDEAIRHAATILKSTFREIDVIGRQGGDEFTLLLIEVTSEDIIQKTIDRLNKNLAKFNDKSDLPYNVEISIGYSLYNSEKHRKTLDELLLEADEHLYENKKARKDKAAKESQ